MVNLFNGPSYVLNFITVCKYTVPICDMQFLFVNIQFSFENIQFTFVNMHFPFVNMQFLFKIYMCLCTPMFVTGRCGLHISCGRRKPDSTSRSVPHTQFSPR